MYVKIFTIIILLIWHTQTFPQNTVNPYRASGGMAREFPNQTLEPSHDPRKLVEIAHLSIDQQEIVDHADEIFLKGKTLSMLIIDKGEIIYEKYRHPARINSVQFSWSMSKSLTAYTIGSLYCDGKIQSLDDVASKYAPVLQGTVQGESKIKNLLTMSSGARNGVGHGLNYRNGTSDDWLDIRDGKRSSIDIIRQFGTRDVIQNRSFNYLNTNTEALGYIAHNLGGLTHNFYKYIWRPARTENKGYWLLDKNSIPVAQGGFSATTRDWARLAMHIIDVQKNGTQCMKNFMENANTKQIHSNWVAKSFGGYGFQVWTNPNFGDKKSFWWLGYGGQRVGIDLVRERIIIVTSMQEDYMSDIYLLFERFQKM
jgi:CubicO group peptidase (beta-lactamase class C family)